MNITGSDVKFFLAYAGAAVTFWRVALWTTRKQILVENFFKDVRTFMEQTATSVNRIETNHLVHQEKYLKALAKVHGVEVEDEPDATSE